MSKPGDLNSMRRDYYGRALLFHLEKFFPKDAETSDLILCRPVEGRLPRAIIGGLLQAIKKSQEGSANHYNHLFEKNVARHTLTDDRVMDLGAFSSDGTIRYAVAHIMKKFVAYLAGMDNGSGRDWLKGQITGHKSFEVMQRDMTPEEIDFILTNITRV